MIQGTRVPSFSGAECHFSPHFPSALLEMIGLAIHISSPACSHSTAISHSEQTGSRIKPLSHSHHSHSYHTSHTSQEKFAGLEVLLSLRLNGRQKLLVVMTIRWSLRAEQVLIAQSYQLAVIKFALFSPDSSFASTLVCPLQAQPRHGPNPLLHNGTL